LAKAAGANVSWGSIGMDAVGAIPGGKVVAGAKNAIVQAGKSATVAKSASAGNILGKVPGIKQPSITMASESAGITSKTVQPITMQALKENPAKAIQDAAQYTHVKSVDTLNKIPGVNITDPFSKAGLAAGTTTQTAIKSGVEAGKNELSDRI
jgi:hypothetical protein